MTANCLGCFFHRGSSGSLTCNRDAPSSLAAAIPPNRAAWLPVNDTDWCGEFAVTDPGVYTPGTPQPGGGQCSTCFFAHGSPGSYVCRWNAPTAFADFGGLPHAGWLPVDDAAWCGQYAASDPDIYGSRRGPPGPSGILSSGTFAWPAAANAVISDAAVTPTCFIALRPLDAGGAAMMATAIENPYELSRIAGTSITLTTTSGYQNPANFAYALLAT